MNKLIIVCGPTSSGKTALALKIAQESNGELVNADSRQIYKYLDIGTNKSHQSSNVAPSGDEVPIHLLSFLNPDERFSVFEFKNLAEAKIDEIFSRGKQPILVGGTGLYIDSIVKNYQPEVNIEGSAKREKLEQLSLEELQAIASEMHILQELNESDRQNPRRLVRLIEKGGNPKINQDSKYEIEMIYPNFEWEDLKTRIENRVDEMFKEGIIEETKKVLEMGFSENSVALQGIGYREVMQFLQKEISLEQCIDRVKTAHKQYAKRQITWFEGKGRGYELKII